MTAAVATLVPIQDRSAIQSLLAGGRHGGDIVDALSVRSVCAGLLAAGLSAALWFLPQTLAVEGRLALIVVVLAVIGWTLTRVPDSLVAIAGALLMVGLGVLQAEDLYASLGSEMIWLLLAAFVMAAVLKASGLLERLVFAAIRPFASVGSLFYGLALVIAFTAFLVPSTSGRAALLLPVFLVLAERLPDPRLVRPLALLFPTVILLSAGGSLIGAGAHFVAADTIGRATGHTIGYLDWLALAFPFALLSSLAGVWLILRLFVPTGLARNLIAPNRAAGTPLDGRQKAIAMVLAAVVAAWMTIPLHGLDVALVAIAGAAVLLSKAFTGLKPKEVFRQVEVELLVFLAATVVIAEGMTASGADRWLAEGALAVLPASVTDSLAMVVMITAFVALAAHLVITSRSARAAVLIPAFALPLPAWATTSRS